MRDKKGQVLIELALVLPLLLLLVFGIFDFARAMYTKNSLTNAARSGARTASLTPAPPLGTETAVSLAATPLSAPATAVKNSLSSGIPADSVTYDLAILDPTTSAPITRALQPGDVVQVTVTYGSFSMITPFYKILGIMTESTPGSSTLRLTGQAAMRHE